MGKQVSIAHRCLQSTKFSYCASTLKLQSPNVVLPRHRKTYFHPWNENSQPSGYVPLIMNLVNQNIQ